MKSSFVKLIISTDISKFVSNLAPALPLYNQNGILAGYQPGYSQPQLIPNVLNLKNINNMNCKINYKVDIPLSFQVQIERYLDNKINKISLDWRNQSRLLSNKQRNQWL